jgi:hypothetical protein
LLRNGEDRRSLRGVGLAQRKQCLRPEAFTPAELREASSAKRNSLRPNEKCHRPSKVLPPATCDQNVTLASLLKKFVPWMKPSHPTLVWGTVWRGASASVHNELRHFGNMCGDKRACAETPLTVMSSVSFPLERNRKGKIMRKLAIAVALSSTLLATPAFARDGAWYVGGEFGAMIVVVCWRRIWCDDRRRHGR